MVLFVCLVPPGSTCLQQRSEKGEATREARGAQKLFACVKGLSKVLARRAHPFVFRISRMGPRRHQTIDARDLSVIFVLFSFMAK